MASNTCCIDTLLMTAMTIFSSSHEYRILIDSLSERDDDVGYFATCVKDMYAALSTKELQVARGLFIMKSSYFSSGSVAQRLSNQTGNRYTVSLDTSEISLAEHFMLPQCPLYRFSYCDRQGCKVRTIKLKFILVDNYDVKSTIEALKTPTPSAKICSEIYYEGYEKRSCHGSRTESEILHDCKVSPPVIIFAVPEPISIEDCRRPVLQNTLEVFAVHYKLQAIHFLQRPKNFNSSGHYTSCVRSDCAKDDWLYYDGLRSKSKPFPLVPRQ